MFFSTEAYSNRSQTYKIGFFEKIIYSWKPLTVFPKSSIFDIWLILITPLQYPAKLKSKGKQTGMKGARDQKTFCEKRT